MNTESHMKFKELEEEINRAAREEEIKFIQFPVEISKTRTRLLFLSSVAITGLYFNIQIDPKILGFEFNNIKNQSVPIMVFFLISLMYLLIHFVWNVIDYANEHKIKILSNRSFGFLTSSVNPENTLTTAINAFIQYLKEFLDNQNISSATKENFEVSYKRIGIYAKGLAVFKKSQLIRFYLIEVGLPLFLSLVAIIMIIRSVN